ncbi:MAG TPA: hypothetical protein VEA79_05625 [Phenylobacterium sp.]|nr:hypothetical protein [Phenylobacterium sp.]
MTRVLHRKPRPAPMPPPTEAQMKRWRKFTAIALAAAEEIGDGSALGMAQRALRTTSLPVGQRSVSSPLRQLWKFAEGWDAKSVQVRQRQADDLKRLALAAQAALAVGAGEPPAPRQPWWVTQ